MEKFIFKKNNKTKEGFTLLEMIVAVGVFTVVMTVAMQVVLDISTIQKKASAFRTVQDNLNFAVDAMVREIRTGENYGVGGVSFSFVNSAGDNITYKIETGQLARSQNGGDFIAITDPAIEINRLDFDASGQGSGDGLQPKVLITLSGKMQASSKTFSQINLQASATQRKPDN